MDSLWWQIFDILGTLAFSLSGTLVAISKRMDIFGVFVLAAATAIGGGIMRDIILGNFPPIAFQKDIYFAIIIFTIALTSIGIRYFDTRLRQNVMHYSLLFYLLCDAVGLGSFTVTGTLMGCYYFPDHWMFDITLGTLTAVGGGVVRDVLAGRVSKLFKHDIYATASIAGAIALQFSYVCLEQSAVSSAFLGFIITVTIRMLAISFKFNLPRVKKKRNSQFF
ncbi:trimeric intracellular cation channel family protein [Megasphaera vaginalis (ex Srinivasan et al. 2021)]|uniref:Putative membrane protein n=1 Tax=Megasphaera vaginalis (ex Srinivasan et al. 2021) TaxID=1111454 RepID=U7UTG3_9FIRM|nr:trimeric intracellular cation channel family protein [Megasphaera vaginalis (ex Srinivasan et al. 2021)]ERT61743.1 putative membrane protein [Megasphaera vaginalis (ex Srinivasan et al. 2021)]